jgi:hypothetical protein
MSTPSLLNVPYRLKAGTLYSQIPETGLGDFAVTRSASNVATRINSLGFIETVADNVPRLDYPLGGAVNGCPALLVEPSAQNTWLQSADANSWLKLDTNVTSDTQISPGGTQNADTVTASGVGSIPHLIYQNLAFTSGTTYTLSVFARANTSNFVQLSFAGNLIANSYANFDLSNGTITASAFVTPQIQNMGNGWYRCSITATAAASATNSQIIYLINSGTAPRAQSFTTTGESVYLFGGQFEASSVPTSYIPTTTAAITRGADEINKSGIASLIGQSEGTIYWEGESLAIGNQDILFVNRNTTNSVVFFKGATNLISARVHANGVTALTITDTVSRTGFLKLAVAYKSGNSTFYINGTRVGTLNTTAFTFTAALDTVRFGESTWLVGRGDQRCRAVAVYPNRLSDTELATLTTP